MGHRKKGFFRKLCKGDFAVLALGVLGFGMLLAIVLPIWVWIAIVAVGLICCSCYFVCK